MASREVQAQVAAGYAGYGRRRNADGSVSYVTRSGDVVGGSGSSGGSRSGASSDTQRQVDAGFAGYGRVRNADGSVSYVDKSGRVVGRTSATGITRDASGRIIGEYEYTNRFGTRITGTEEVQQAIASDAVASRMKDAQRIDAPFQFARDGQRNTASNFFARQPKERAVRGSDIAAPLLGVQIENVSGINSNPKASVSQTRTVTPTFAKEGMLRTTTTIDTPTASSSMLLSGGRTPYASKVTINRDEVLPSRFSSGVASTEANLNRNVGSSLTRNLPGYAFTKGAVKEAGSGFEEAGRVEYDYGKKLFASRDNTFAGGAKTYGGIGIMAAGKTTQVIGGFWKATAEKPGTAALSFGGAYAAGAVFGGTEGFLTLKGLASSGVRARSAYNGAAIGLKASGAIVGGVFLASETKAVIAAKEPGERLAMTAWGLSGFTGGVQKGKELYTRNPSNTKVTYRTSNLYTEERGGMKERGGMTQKGVLSAKVGVPFAKVEAKIPFTRTVQFEKSPGGTISIFGNTKYGYGKGFVSSEKGSLTILDTGDNRAKLYNRPVVGNSILTFEQATSGRRSIFGTDYGRSMTINGKPVAYGTTFTEGEATVRVGVSKGRRTVEIRYPLIQNAPTRGLFVAGLFEEQVGGTGAIAELRPRPFEAFRPRASETTAAIEEQMTGLRSRSLPSPLGESFNRFDIFGGLRGNTGFLARGLELPTSRTLPIPKPSTALRPSTTSFYGANSISGGRSRVSSIATASILSGAEASPAALIVPAAITTAAPDFITKSPTRTTPKTIASSITDMPGTRPPREVPPFPAFGFPAMIPPGGGGRGERFTKPTRGYNYAPSLTALFSGERSSKARSAFTTGLENRPIFGSEPRKRRKTSKGKTGRRKKR